jgi:hypothetical protein
MATPSTESSNVFPITRLQGDAWAAWNASFHAEEKAVYQTLGRDLYAQDVHDRIQALFARSDAQNAFLDEVFPPHAA